MSLLDHRIIVVTGKGGSGKSTVCAALGLLAARAGKRVLVAETSGADALPTLFGVPGRGYQPVRLAEGLETLSITPLEAIEDYVVQQIKVRKLYEMVFRNRVMSPFVDGVPGLHDAVQLGKVWDCAVQQKDAQGRHRWDVVIVDAPATGHGLTMLEAPRSMMELTRVGPMYRGNERVEEVLGDPRQTRMVVVALPEEMPVAETLDLHARLGERRRQLSLCVLNEVHPRAPTTASDWARARPSLLASGQPAVIEAADLVDAWMERLVRQDGSRQRLAEGMGLPVVDLPFFFQRKLGLAEVALLADHLAPAVEAA